MLHGLRAALLILLFVAPGAFAEDAPSAPKAPPDAERAAAKAKQAAKERDAALVRSMRFLDRKLLKGTAPHGPQRYAMAVAGWAYLLAEDEGGGGLPGRQSALTSIRGTLRKPARKGYRTWEYAMAAHFFAESRARSPRSSAARRDLRRYIGLLEAHEQSGGGWIHDVDASQLRASYPRTLLAASTHALSAIAIGRATLKLPAGAAVARGIAYLESAQSEDGSFPYDPGRRVVAEEEEPKADEAKADETKADAGVPHPLRGTDIARTGGAVFALLCCGLPEERRSIARAIQVVDAQPQYLAEGHGSASMSLLHGALAAKVRGARAWMAFRDRFFPRILANQQKDGSFTCICTCLDAATTCDSHELHHKFADPTYITAVMTLILMLDRGRLRAVEAARD